jgi:FixJ family two-component response regulator
MPGMSGNDMSKILLAKQPDMPVLYMSGYTDDAIVQHGVLEPGINFLQKPFSPGALAVKVREVLDARS